jgi:hypothetical protein
MMKTFFRVAGALLLSSALGVQAFDFQQFMAETQRLQRSAEGIALVWWIPTDFWSESFKQSSNLTPRQRDEFLVALEPYSVFAVLRVDVGALGVMKPHPRSQMLDTLDIKCNGSSLTAVADTQLSPEMKNIMMIMKPMLANVLGQFGQGLEFVVFTNSKAGKKIVDPRREDRLTGQFYGHLLNWRLPLGSLLAPKVDPATGEEFPGNYGFNPFTGAALATKK